MNAKKNVRENINICVNNEIQETRSYHKYEKIRNASVCVIENIIVKYERIVRYLSTSIIHIGCKLSH